ncbi:glucuronyl hydrolase [Lacihabitans lacunae]|uniref:Glucuronyl hydrolase n=1 Tax=Lacihabitans lacunae TaxID=1028214 RepID=A0ABV7YUZ8_9BACT
MSKKTVCFFLFILISSGFGFAQKLESKIESQLKYSLSEIEKSQKRNPKGVSPRSMREDTLFMVPSKDWTSGFYAGNLWYTYELTQNPFWKQKAIEFTAPIEKEKFDSTTHDLGFKLFCSFGNGNRIAPNKAYRDIIIQASYTLCSRFSPVVGSLKSWNHSTDKWVFPVIIDNMMNLEMLFWAFKETNDSLFYKVAVSHANTTMKNHFRADGSSYHVIDYNPKTGEVLQKNTHQGYSHESSWARGQAWGLYGYSMCYRETGDMKYLQHAERIADFILNNPALPQDLIPYWDYNDPKIPNAPKDVSAAAITASALFELSTFTTLNSKKYRNVAELILKNIDTKHWCKIGTKGGFLLDNSTGHLPGNHEINVPIVYADYYYLEALLRSKSLKQ